MRTMILAAMTLTTALNASCGDEKEDEHDHGAGAAVAEAALAPKSGNTTLAGKVEFSGAAPALSVKVSVTGAPPGQHGVHIHETGDCSAADAMSAGGHWNPTTHDHGTPGPTVHAGDLGNLTVAADGTGSVSVSNATWEVGTGTANDVVGKAVVVHAMVDDFTTQPTGNSGGRIGCGVIAKH